MFSRPDGPLGQNVSKFAQDMDAELAAEVATAGV
jgi:hypothetical protein